MNPRKLYSAGLKLFFVAVIFIIQLVYVFFASQKLNTQRFQVQEEMNALVHQIDMNIKTSISKAPQQLLRGKQLGLERDGIDSKMKAMEDTLSIAGAQFRDLMIILGAGFLLQILLIGSAGFSLMRATKK